MAAAPDQHDEGQPPAGDALHGIGAQGQAGERVGKTQLASRQKPHDRDGRQADEQARQGVIPIACAPTGFEI
jgi:hypothetical protein